LGGKSDSELTGGEFGEGLSFRHRCLERLPLEALPIALGSFFMSLSLNFFFVWALSLAPYEVSVFDMIAKPIYDLLGPEGYLGMNLPFVGLSYYRTLTDLMFHVITALGLWTLFCWVIIFRLHKTSVMYIKCEQEEEAVSSSARAAKDLTPEQKHNYTKLESDFLKGMPSYLETLKAKSSDSVVTQKVKDAVGLFEDLGLKIKDGASKDEVRGFRYDRFVHYVFKDVAIELAIPQIPTVCFVALFALQLSVVSYTFEIAFHQLYKYIIVAAIVVFAWIASLVYRLGNLKARFMTFKESTRGDGDWQKDLLTPQFLACILQTPVYFLCYSTTRIMFSPDMFQHHFRLWTVVCINFTIFTIFVWTIGSRFFRSAVDMMALPPNITLDNLNKYLNIMKKGGDFAKPKGGF
jgi:hypothetical protein